MKSRPILFSGPMVRDARVGLGNNARKIAIDDNHLRQLFSEGKTAAEIAIVYGCSTYPIKNALVRLGLRRPAKRRKGVAVGDKNPAWKGGRRTRPDGYIAIWTPSGERLEHQVVMENAIGRPLLDNEVVHHIDGVKSNNRIENLELTTQSHHIRKHLPDMNAARYNK